MYNLRWRLAYADDSVIDEALEGSSIKDTRPGAIAIQLVSWAQGQPRPVSQVFLEGQKPIFYRRRSMAANQPGGITTDAVIFGRGRETDDGFDGELYEWDGLGVIDCLQENIDRSAIEWLVSNA